MFRLHRAADAELLSVHMKGRSEIKINSVFCLSALQSQSFPSRSGASASPQLFTTKTKLEMIFSRMRQTSWQNKKKNTCIATGTRFYASSKSWKPFAEVASMFSKRFTSRRPYVSNNMALFPGGFLITKLSKLAPCSRGDALLLGGSLSAGTRTILL